MTAPRHASGARRLRGTALFLLCWKITGLDAAGAQLRPLDPLDWSVFDRGTRITAQSGIGLLEGQRASLAGTEGRLWELGTLHALARSGRVALEAGGTLHRILLEERRLTPPHGGAREQPLGRRADSGDYRITTNVLLGDPRHPAVAALRFGTRLPTTDNRVGLERDQTDFFALAAARYDAAFLRLAAEAGLGIYGTRMEDYEQSDVLAYALSARTTAPGLTAAAILVGHRDGRAGPPIPGNEPLSELRLLLRTPGPLWLQLQLVRGLASHSPRRGLLLTAGTAR